MKNRLFVFAKWFLLILSTVLLASVLGMFLFLGSRLANITDREATNTKENETEINEVRDVIDSDTRLNVLILGKDNTSGLCDVIMLVSYNVTDSSLGVVQIPRDTYLKYTSSSYKKINGAVASLGSERALCDLLEDAFCIEIDHYVSLKLDAIGKLVDAIGGVEINVPSDMDYEDPAQGLSIHIKKGLNLLDGRTAEQFVRFRSGYTTGDLGRMDAQKLFLAALANKLKNEVSVFEMGVLVASLSDSVKTSFPLSEMISLSKKALAISPENIRFVTLAGESAVAKKSGASYYVISKDSSREIINSFFGVDVNEHDFDKNKLFLNGDYTEFKNIYYSKTDYTVIDADTIERH